MATAQPHPAPPHPARRTPSAASAPALGAPALGALALGALLALSGCAQSDAREDAPIDRGSQTTGTEAGTGTDTSGTEQTAAHGDGAGSPPEDGAPERIDVAASMRGLEQAGYRCAAEACDKTASGVAYTIELDAGELAAEVRETGSTTALHPHYDTLLGELGSHISPAAFGGMDWPAIRQWANAHADAEDHEVEAGQWTIEAEFDDDAGKRARILRISD